jgi:hypothetical protein
MFSPSHPVKNADLTDVTERLDEVRKSLKADRQRFSVEQLTILYRYRRALLARKAEIEAESMDT